MLLDDDVADSPDDKMIVDLSVGSSSSSNYYNNDDSNDD